MLMPHNNTPSVLYQQIRSAIAAMQSAWPADQKAVTLLKVSYTPAELQQKLQSLLAPFQAAVDTHSAWMTALADRNDAVLPTQAFMSAFYVALPQYLGPNNADQSKFGKKPPKARAPLTAEQKAAATTKRNATRAARHIMGPKQRKAIKAPVSTAAPAPATPATTPASTTKPGP